MNISWVLSNTAVLDPTVELDRLKLLGSFWGSWQTWRAFQTDNVICHDQQRAVDLVKRNFHTNCNFYIPNSVYVSMDRPMGVKVYQGDFVHDVDRQEEIVALHLAASTSDIVLLLGFDLTELETIPDRLLNHRAHHHRNLLHHAIKDNAKTQWVVVDHSGKLDPNLAVLENVVQDTINSVLAMISD